MAIPIRAIITCPTCQSAEDVTMGDVSEGPHGKTSDTPIYVLFKSPLWEQTKRDGETYLSCTTCGEREFATLNHLGDTLGRRGWLADWDASKATGRP